MELSADTTEKTIGGQAIVISAPKVLHDQGIVESIRLFCVQLISNKETRRIMKATMQPTLEDAAAPIAAVVEAESPANRPTLKGLIHKDFDKTTKELHCRIQNLEAKLSATTPKSAAENGEGGGSKSKAGSVTTPKNQSHKRRSQHRRRRNRPPPRRNQLPPRMQKTLPPLQKAMPPTPPQKVN
jgi:hypothetical protein